MSILARRAQRSDEVSEEFIKDNFGQLLGKPAARVSVMNIETWQNVRVVLGGTQYR